MPATTYDEDTRLVRTPTRADVRSAQHALAGRIVRTPVLRSAEIDRLVGARVWLKAENLQRGGSFKLRGALVAVARLSGRGARGVVAQSTGNHAIAVASAARDHGLPGVLVLPPDAAPAKVAAVRATGGEAVLEGSTPLDRAAVVDRLRAERCWEVVDPWEDPDVVVGQGTATSELIDQVSSAGGRLDTVVLPVGGGSALAGACLAATGLGIDVVAAEPAAVPALTGALRAGHPVTVRARPTIADGLRPDRIGRLPFAICESAVAGVITVDEPAIADALCRALLQARLLVEPAAATALAGAVALLAGPAGDVRDVGVVLTGGNVEPALVARLLADRDRVGGAA